MIPIISVWETKQHVDEFIRRIQLDSQVKQLVIFGAFEWCYTSFVNKDTAFEEIISVARQKNIQVDVITGSHKLTDACHDVTNSKYNNVTVHHWPTFWMTYYSTLTHQLDNGDHVVDNLYTLFNNVPHRHRCMTMDILSREDLLRSGYVSWNNLDNYENYSFKHWTPKLLTLDDFSRNRSLSTVPVHFFKSFMNIVSESNTIPYFVTEKTVKPIFYKKPFLVISKQGFHTKVLTDLGFKLYDEIFDYSFDSIEDMECRIEQIVLQLKRLQTYSPYKLKLMTNRIKDKLEHNHKVLSNYMTSIDTWPQIVKDLVDEPDFKRDRRLSMIYTYCKDNKDQT